MLLKLKRRELNLCLLFTFLALHLNVGAAPYIALSSGNVETGVVNKGRKGINIVSEVYLSDMLGKEIGFMGTIYKDGENLRKSTWDDMFVVEKVTEQNLPLVKIFVPIDSLTPGNYRAGLYAYDYSQNPPKLISKGSYGFRVDSTYCQLDIIKYPTFDNPTIKLKVTADEPIKEVMVYGNKKIDSKTLEDGSSSVELNGKIEGKYGRINLRISTRTVSRKIIRQERDVYIDPSVFVGNVQLAPNSFGGEYHKVVYDCISRLPKGERYGLQAEIVEVRPNNNSPFKDDRHWVHYTTIESTRTKSRLNFKIQSSDIDTISSGQILVSTKALALDPSKKYRVSITPYIYNDHNWDCCIEGFFTSLFDLNEFKKEQPLVNDNNGITFEWITAPKETNSPTAQIKVGIKSPSTLKKVSLEVNGQKMRGVKVINNDGFDMVLSEAIALAEGYNEIKVIAENKDGKNQTLKEIIRNNNEKKSQQADRQSALVIGNAAYPGNELINTTNDAADMSQKLKDLGFDVMQLSNGTKEQTEKIIEQFAAKAALMKVSYLFYAGHAIQLNGVNYLIPVDAKLSSQQEIATQCVNLDEVINKLDESGCELKIFSLDACRNNPFTNSNMPKGLSRLNMPAAIGTVVSFATAPGMVALDGTGRNSPYTTALLSVLNVPHLSLDQVFNRVGLKVIEATGKQQQPWITKTVINGDFIFNNK